MSTEKIDFGRLFELYAEDVRSALRRYGGPQMFVEDGLQEVFEIALRDYRAARPPRPWLLKTAFHVAQNWRRMAQRAREVAGVGVDSVDEISPEHWFTVTETRVRVHSVINTLDEDLRQVFIMAEIEDIPLA